MLVFTFLEAFLTVCCNVYGLHVNKWYTGGSFIANMRSREVHMVLSCENEGFRTVHLSLSKSWALHKQGKLHYNLRFYGIK